LGVGLTDLAKSFAPFGWFTLLASVQSSLLFAAFAEVALGCKPTFRTLRFSLPANLGSIAVIWCCSVVWSLAIAPLNFLRSFEFHQVGRQCVEFKLHRRLWVPGFGILAPLLFFALIAHIWLFRPEVALYAFLFAATSLDWRFTKSAQALRC